jgi:alkanesulfonate monooxygenase SsuD/methylene tetrahydromethanopterin reductase-like flavin-dependent oxidoreductase (luciferase family)
MEFGVSIFCQNFNDWGRFLEGGFDRSPNEPDGQMYFEDLALADLVEPLGYDSLWTVEHHFTPYTMVPNALQLLTWFAARTEKVALGTMVVVLPWHQPVRVAEQFSMLDCMTQGRRMILGFGRGAARREYDPFGVSMSEATDRFIEAHEVVRKALTQERFSYDGKYYQYPEMSIRPRPRSKDFGRLTYVAAQSEASVRRAAEMDMGMLIIPQKTWEEYANDVAYFNSRRRELGLGYMPPISGCFIYCAETEEEAREGARVYMPNMSYTSTVHYEADDPEHFKTITGYDHYRERAELLLEKTREQHAESGGQENYTRTQIWGTPDQCLEKIRNVIDNTSPSEMFGVFRFGGIPIDKAEKSMRLFAKEVLPEIQKMSASTPELVSV